MQAVIISNIVDFHGSRLRTNQRGITAQFRFVLWPISVTKTNSILSSLKIQLLPKFIEKIEILVTKTEENSLKKILLTLDFC